MNDSDLRTSNPLGWRVSQIFLSMFFFSISIIFSFETNYFIVSPGTPLFFYLILILLLTPLLELFFKRYLQLLRFYPISIFAMANLILATLDFSNVPIFALQSAAFLLSLRYIIFSDSRRIFHITFIFYGISMLFLSSLLRVSVSNFHPQMYIFNSSDDIRTAGIPIFFSNGVVMSSPKLFVLTISLQYLIVILILGFFLLENADRILAISRQKKVAFDKKGQSLGLVSTSFSVFSCQCETTTSIIPAIGSEILGLVSLPIIAESIILSLGTFIMIHLLLNKGEMPFFKKRWETNGVSLYQILLISFFIILSPVIVTLGVFLNLQSNLLFYFGTNLGMFALGLFAFLTLFDQLNIRIRTARLVYAALGMLSLVLMAIWYFPFVLSFTVSSGLVFSIMGIISVFAGSIGAIILSSVNRVERSIIYEYLTGMFPIIFVIILYYTIISGTQIWVQFSITDQLLFSLLLLGFTLPFMWYSTNLSIYGYYKNHSR